MLAALVDAGVVTRGTAINSTYIKIQRVAFGSKGGAPHKRSVPGWLDHKDPCLTDVIGSPYALMLTSGNGSDIKAAPALLEQVGRMRYPLNDNGYDTDSLRRSLREADAIPVIPGRWNRRRTIRYEKPRYCGHHLVENALFRLKDFRRVATRYDKLVVNFVSAVALAMAVAFNLFWITMLATAMSPRVRTH
ncbi:transposase [Sphingomonas sp. LB2R24]|uniref:transposase n=1 Tax=Sphingomonas sorbitolis TaxID=3096165 RepID=UPI002FC84D6D